MAKYQFGDVFVEAMNRERDRRQRQEEFKQTLGFQQRQLNLLEAFKWAGLKQEEERYKSEDELKRQKEIGGMLQSGFLPAEEGFIEGRQNLITGKFDTHEQTVELFGKKFAYPKEKAKPYEESELIPMLGGLMETKYEIDPTTGKKRIKGYGTLYKSEKSGGEKPYEESELVPMLGGLMETKYEIDSAGKKRVKDYGTLYRDEKSEKVVDISQEVGKISALLKDYQYEYEGESDDAAKKKWRSNAQQYLAKMMTKVGIPMDSEMITQIRKEAGFIDKDMPEKKKEKWNQVIDALKEENALTPEQYYALRLYIEVKTK